MPGVKGVRIIQGPGTEIQWAMDEIALVAAVDEGTAEDAARAIKVSYEVLPHVVNERELEKVPAANRRPPTEQTKGDPEAAFNGRRGDRSRTFTATTSSPTAASRPTGW
jgi:xanthine dehydrogenase YagR molybdenum-binding subunit